MLGALLTPAQDVLRAETRALLGELQSALERFNALAADLDVLRRSALQLDELFLLVVAGEFNAGKSAFINALLGDAVLQEGVTPTTTRVNIIRHGPELKRERVESALDLVTAPAELLREIAIVDTPGTNAIHREHEAITREFVPRSDLVLFVTSADRPFTESERAFLEGIRDWGKKIVVVVNKVDILERPEDVESIRSFIAENARALLGLAPEIFFVSARQALQAKRTGDAALLERSRYPALERHLETALEARERIRLKLANPLGVAAHLAQRYGAVAAARLELLQTDLAALGDIDGQLGVYRQDLAREFRFRLADVDNALHEFERRGLVFLDETMRLGRIFDLLNKERTKAAFQTQVVAELPGAIEKRVTEVIDWLVSSDLRQWQAVTAHIAARRQVHADHIIGSTAPFDLDRARLLDSVGGAAQRTVASYDREAEATQMAESVQAAVASTALVEVGAIGLGALVAHVLAGAAADATGVLAASVVAVLGLFIIPSRREAAKRELRTKIAALRERLVTALTAQFDREVERSVHRIEEAVGPYTRFVRAEQAKLVSAQRELAAAAERAALLKERVELE